MNKKIFTALAAATAFIGTPVLAADAYKLEDNQGTKINVMEVSQTELKEILAPILDTQTPKPNMSREEILKAKNVYNFHIRDRLYKQAKKLGYDNRRAMSVASAIANIAGRDTLSKEQSIYYSPYEFDPSEQTPVNGTTPGTQPSLSTIYPNGVPVKYRSCGIITVDKGYLSSEWYKSFSNKTIDNEVLPPEYVRFFEQHSKWQGKAGCFMTESDYSSAYFGTLQLLNENFSHSDLPGIKSFLKFMADTYVYAYQTKYLDDRSKYTGAAIMMALESFEAQKTRKSEREIWTMLTNSEVPSDKKLAQKAKTYDTSAFTRQEGILSPSLNYARQQMTLHYSAKF